jgi:RimJ/RimL family protein N-acetyltransferase
MKATSSASTARDRRAGLAGQTCRSLARRGKYLLLGLDRLAAAFGIAPGDRNALVSNASTQEGRLIMTNVRLCDVTTDDLPRIERWLHADHMRRTWGDPDENMRLLRNGPANHHWRALIEADGRAVGLVLWQHPTRQELDEAGLIDIPETVIDIDIMIGERGDVGKGVGSAAIRLVAERALSDPAVPFVIAAVLVDNLASQRAFAKAGFRNDREFDDVPSGRCVLMLRPRQDGSVADERS